MNKGDPPPRSFASPPCLAAEIAPDYFDPLAVDPQQAVDVARWRKARRAERLKARAALTVSERQTIAAAISDQLNRLMTERFSDIRGKVISGYWPIKSEPDLRPWMTRMHLAGAVLALPVVETAASPLIFRPWHPASKMERGHWSIPVPATSDTILPEITLAPLVGWDPQGFRLGYGGGYFDRTLASLAPRPFAIGVGLQSARIGTIYPQPHDIRLDAILTEDGLRWP